MDAYRDDLGLHYNSIATGSAQTGKSFNLDMLAKLAIPGSVNTMMYASKKSQAVHGNQSDAIRVLHEVPQEMTGLDRGGGASFMKEAMTSNMMRAQVLTMDKDGNRRTERFECETIGTTHMAMNDEYGRLDDALKTRMAWTPMQEKTRPGRNPIDLQGSLLSDFGRALKRETTREFNVQQFLMFFVEKLIMARVVRDVNMKVADTVFGFVLKHMRTAYQVYVDAARSRARMRIVARLMTIAYAIQVVFHSEVSPLRRRGDDDEFEITLELVRELEEHLCCTEEIALFVFSLLKAEYVTPLESRITKTIEKVWGDQMESSYVVDTVVNDVGADGAPRERRDYDYRSFTVRDFTLFAERIRMSIGYPVPAKDEVKSILFTLKARTVMEPDKEPNGDEKAEGEHAVPALQIVKDHSGHQLRVMFAKRFRSNYSDDMVAGVIRAYCSEFTRRRHILIAESVKELAVDYPHVLRSIELAPNPDRKAWLGNAAFYTRANEVVIGIANGDGTMRDAMRSTSEYYVDRDIEQIVFGEHFSAIGRPTDGSYNWRSLPEIIDTRIAAVRAADPELRQLPTICYPDDMVEEYLAHKRRISTAKPTPERIPTDATPEQRRAIEARNAAAVQAVGDKRDAYAYSNKRARRDGGHMPVPQLLQGV
jgi:hypothetical protein